MSGIKNQHGAVRFPRGEPDPPGPVVSRPATPEERARYGIARNASESEAQTMLHETETSPVETKRSDNDTELEVRDTKPLEAVRPPGRGHPLPTAVREQIREMALMGATAKEIGRTLGLKPSTVAYHMEKADRRDKVGRARSPKMGSQRAKTPVPTPAPTVTPPAKVPVQALPEILVALLQDLPPRGRCWTRQDDWLVLWGAAVRYIYPHCRGDDDE